MPGTNGGIPAPQDRHVWLLGNTHPNADRSIRWDDDPFPNLSDPDALVVDLTTLTGPVLERIGKTKLDQARLLVRDKIISRGTVVAITQPFLPIVAGRALSGDTFRSPSASYMGDPRSYSNYQIFPTQLATKDVPVGGVIEVDLDHTFKEYVDNVRRFSFYIEQYLPRAILETEISSSVKTELGPVRGQEIKDNSGHDLGMTLTPEVVDHYNGGTLPHGGAGLLTFLPPPTEPIDDAIGRILSALGKNAPHAEPLPAWAEQLSLGRANEYKEQVAELKENKAKIEGEIDRLVHTTDEILAHRRLLYTKGPELEDAVVQAFKALGFGDIELMGSADEEDAAFAMGDGTRYARGVVEAKGSDRGAQMQHILQCKKWANQRVAVDGKASKGILVYNQHRLQPYPESRGARVKFERNQLDQAEMNDICIIPSCALFEAVRRVLDGEEPDRAKIAAKIAASKEVLRDVL